MVRARIGMAALAALLLGACPAHEDGGVDAGVESDGGGDGDGAASAPSLRFVFVSRPTVPGEWQESGYSGSLTQAAISLEDVRSFGDAAPGDERTTLAKTVLDFAVEPGANEVFFPNAPPSRYSHLAAQIQSYTFVGTVVLDQDPIPFSIIDVPPAPVSVYVELDDVVVTDSPVEVEIQIDLERVLAEIPWEGFDPGATSIEIDSDSPLIGDIRDHVRHAFESEDDD